MDRTRLERPLLLAGALLFLLSCNQVPLGHYVDDLVWVLLSRNMLRGSLMASWSYFPRLETSATWGFSALLAPVVAVFGQNALALKAASAAMFFAGTALFYLSTSELFSPAARSVYLLGLFFNGFTLSFSGSVLSEAGYMLLFGLGTWLAVEKGWLWRSTPAQTALLGVLAGLIVLTRVIGASFLLAAALELALCRPRREGLRFSLAAGATALPYFLLCKAAAGAYTYHAAGWAVWDKGAGPAAAVRLLSSNALYYLKGLSLLTFVYFPSFMPNAAALKFAAAGAVAAVAALGFKVRAGQARGRFLLVYGLIYALVCVAWPFQSPRFALPLLPLFFSWFLAGFSSLLPRRRQGLGLALLGMAVLATNAGELAGSLRASFTQAPDLPHRSHLWLGEHTAPEDLIVSMDIARIRYYAGRRGLHFVPSDSLEDFVRRSRALKVRYFFLKDAAYIPATLGGSEPVKAQYDRLRDYLRHGEFFRLVYEDRDEGVGIYDLRSDS